LGNLNKHASKKKEDFEVKLLAVGSNPMSFFADEVQLNIALTEINKEEELIQDVELVLVDAFKPDAYNLSELNFGKEADYLFTKMITYCIEEGIDIKLGLEGNGIGEQYGAKLRPIVNQKEELKKYPGETKEERI